jgi:heat shock protein HslJ
VVIGQMLRLEATASGVVIIGEAGAVPGNTRVDVLNTTTGQSTVTTSAADGSFELEMPGSTSDEYRVYAASDGRSWTTELTRSGASTSDTTLAGHIFLLQSAQGYTPLTGTTLRLTFRNDNMTFSAGCNSFFGDYSLCDGKLCAADLLGTEIGCGEERQSQDQWFQAFLASTPGLSLSGGALTLTGAQATLELLDIELADPDRPLTGRLWRIDGFLEGSSGSSVGGPTTPTLEFSADGSLHVFTGCNTGDGTYTRSGQTLLLSSMTYTEEPCDVTDSGLAQERIQAVLSPGELSFDIEAARLTLRHGEPGLQATSD